MSNGDPSMKLESGSLCSVWGRCCGGLDLSVPAPRGRAAGGLPRMPCGQLQASPCRRGRRWDWKLEGLGFQEGGGREEEVGGRVAGLESWNSRGRGRRTGDWHSWVQQGSGTRWLIKVPEVQVPDSRLRQSLAFAPPTRSEEKRFQPKSKRTLGAPVPCSCSGREAQRGQGTVVLLPKSGPGGERRAP